MGEQLGKELNLKDGIKKSFELADKRSKEASFKI